MCTRIFNTLRALAAADVSGDVQRIHELVPNAPAAARIARYGRYVRSHAVRHFHVVPSFTLQTFPRYIGAGFYLVGDVPHGHLNDQDVLYMQVRKDRAVVVGDQPGQAW